MRRTQAIAKSQDSSPAENEQRRRPEVSEPEAQPAASEAKKTGPYGVDRRIDPRLKFERPSATEPAAPPGEAERRVHQRITLETSNSENERRERQRRHTEAMRAQLKRTMPQERKQSVLERFGEKFRGVFALKPSRILLLAVALITGGVAAFLASRLDQQTSNLAAEPDIPVIATQVVPEARTKILVAKASIGIGQRLSPASVEWQDWPEGAVRADYISLENTPEAMTTMSGALARFEIFPGEPIRPEKLALAGDGYLSAVLGAGLRGVSVLVSAQTAAGGFVVPNDHVDVVMVEGGAAGYSAQTILKNVRVLAINDRLGEGNVAETGEEGARAQVFANDAIATLEVNQVEAELLVAAVQGGNLALVLRSMADFGDRNPTDSVSTNQAIRLTSPFWTNNGAPEALR